MRRVFHTLLMLWAVGAAAAPLELQYVAANGKGIEGGLVVTLRSTDASRPVARPVAAVLDQVDRQFTPHVLVIPRGSKVSFPNSDSVAHQVYSISQAKRFELPLYSGKAAVPQQGFDREGIVSVGCNIHDQMRAYIYVVEAQYFGRADKDGRWSVANVEPGDYQLTIWHPRSRAPSPVLEQRVTIGAEGAQLKLRAATPLKLRSESQIPSNWDVY
jgi:plastocyanin